jgi:hypothetical protein
MTSRENTQQQGEEKTSYFGNQEQKPKWTKILEIA